MRKRIISTIVAITVMVLVVGVAYWMNARTRWHTITVTNAGQNTISTLVVTVCGVDYSFQNIPSHGYSQQVFVVSGDSGFLVKGEFSDGVAIAGGFGYVTKNVSRQHVEIVVYDCGTVTGKQ